MEFIPCRIKSAPDLFAAAETAKQINPDNAPDIGALRQAAPKAVLTPAHLAVLTAKRWPSSGVHLTVSFLDNPEQALKERILSHMNAWQQFSNVTFTLVASGGDVRIARAADGYWSYLGTDIKSIPANEPTMNLQAFSMNTPESEYHRVVRHETGHTLGFPHEHMRKALVDRIDRQKAYAYFLRTQGWDQQTVDQQVLTPLDPTEIIGTEADQDSIMCYQLPAEITTDGQPIHGGVDINDSDGRFAGIVYPKSFGAGAGAPTSAVAGEVPVPRAGAVVDWDPREDRPLVLR